MTLKPFWRYYGGKWANAKHYEPPRFNTIVEPFAGAAGYSHHFPSRDVVLVEKNPIVAAVWRWLIAASSADVLAVGDIPDGGTVDDIDAPQAARWLAGFWCNEGVTMPRKRPSAWAARSTKPVSGWGKGSRARVASQVAAIKHWTIIECDYSGAPDVEATWFIDPPYVGRAGRHYPFQPDDFDALGVWCQTRRGQVIVCEQAGAAWLPFRPLASFKSTSGKNRPNRSAEVVWTSGETTRDLFGGAA